MFEKQVHNELNAFSRRLKTGWQLPINMAVETGASLDYSQILASFFQPRMNTNERELL